MRQYDFVINFITEMGKLDAAANIVPLKVQEIQQRIQRAAVAPIGVSQKVQKGEIASVRQGKEQIKNAQDLIKGNKGLADSQTQGVAVLNKQAKAFHQGNVAMRESARQLGGVKGAYGSAVATIKAQPIGEILGKVALWTVATGVIFGTIAGIRKLISRSIELEEHFANLARVIPTQRLGEFTGEISAMAHGFGVATDQVIDATFEWGKTTKNTADIVYGQQASILAVKVAELELGEATKYLTAMYHSLDIKGVELIATVDKLNALQNQFGANIQGTMEVMARSAPIISTYGASFDQIMGLSAAAMKLTGEMPTKVATLWRTMPRFIINNQREIESLTRGLGENAVAIRKSETEYHSFEDILNSIMGAYENLDEVSGARLVGLIAEGRSASILTTLLENQDIALAMVEATANAAGSAMIEYAQIMDTTAEKSRRLSATFDELASAKDSGISRFFGEMIDSLDTILGLLADVSKVQLPEREDKVGTAMARARGVLPMATGIGAFAGIGRARTALEIAGLGKDELAEVESFRDKWNTMIEISEDMQDAMAGLDLPIERKVGILTKRLVAARGDLTKQTEKQIMGEILMSAFAIEQQESLSAAFNNLAGVEEGAIASRADVIEKMAEENELVAEHKEALLRQAELYGILADASEGSEEARAAAAKEFKRYSVQIKLGLATTQELIDAIQDEIDDTKDIALMEELLLMVKELKMDQMSLEHEKLLADAPGRLERAELAVNLAKEVLLAASGTAAQTRAEIALKAAEKALANERLRYKNALIGVEISGTTDENKVRDLEAEMAQNVLDAATGVIEILEAQAALKNVYKSAGSARSARKKASSSAADLREAELQYAYEGIRDPLIKAKAEIAAINQILSWTKGRIKQLQLLGRLRQKQWDLEDEVYRLERAKKELFLARMIDDVRREDILILMDLANLERIEQTQGLAARLEEEASIVERIRSQQMTKYEQEKRILDMRKELGEITIQQQIEAIATLAETIEMTEEQMLELKLELRNLQEESERLKRESFNLPTIKLPTVYEIRRSLGEAGYTTGTSYIDNRNININISRDVDLWKVEKLISKTVDRNISISGGARGLTAKAY